MSAAHQPFIKWYPTDWRADPRLRMCSLGARGLWIELIGYMHEGEPYGHLTINGAKPTIQDIAALVGRPLGEVRKAIGELEQRQVFSTEAMQGTIYSRRMVRDKAKAEQDRRNGKGGGNPKLRGEVKEGVNPPDKAHIPEARSQTPQPERKQPRAPALEDDWPADFGDQFWQAYPRKTEKLAAMKKLANLRKSGIVTFADLIAGAKRYAAATSNTEPKYVKQPTTWLNAGCWADEIHTGGGNGNGNIHPQRRSASADFFAGMRSLAADIAGDDQPSGPAEPEVPLGRFNIDG